MGSTQRRRKHKRGEKRWEKSTVRDDAFQNSAPLLEGWGKKRQRSVIFIASSWHGMTKCIICATFLQKKKGRYERNGRRNQWHPPINAKRKPLSKWKVLGFLIPRHQMLVCPKRRSPAQNAAATAFLPARQSDPNIKLQLTFFLFRFVPEEQNIQRKKPSAAGCMFYE